MTSSASQVDRHPRKAFLVLFLVEIWERFGYYGIASILVLYMVQRRVLLALPLVWFYQRMGKTKRGDFSIASKYAAGLYLLAIAFFLYAASSLTAHAGIVSSWWLVAGFAAQSLGELLISALGFSMVSQLVPEHSRGIIMGAWFLGVGVSLYAGGAIAGLASIPSGTIGATATLPIYTHLFWGLGAGALACAIVATAITPLLQRMMLERDEEPPQALVPVP